LDDDEQQQSRQQQQQHASADGSGGRGGSGGAAAADVDMPDAADQACGWQAEDGELVASLPENVHCVLVASMFCLLHLLTLLCCSAVLQAGRMMSQLAQAWTLGNRAMMLQMASSCQKQTSTQMGLWGLAATGAGWQRMKMLASRRKALAGRRRSSSSSSSSRLVAGRRSSGMQQRGEQLLRMAVMMSGKMTKRRRGKQRQRRVGSRRGSSSEAAWQQAVRWRWSRLARQRQGRVGGGAAAAGRPSRRPRRPQSRRCPGSNSSTWRARQQTAPLSPGGPPGCSAPAGLPKSHTQWLRQRQQTLPLAVMVA
jgi:hypothetical protein